MPKTSRNSGALLKSATAAAKQAKDMLHIILNAFVRSLSEPGFDGHLQSYEDSIDKGRRGMNKFLHTFDNVMIAKMNANCPPPPNKIPPSFTGERKQYTHFPHLRGSQCFPCSSSEHLTACGCAYSASGRRPPCPSGHRPCRDHCRALRWQCVPWSTYSAPYP